MSYANQSETVSIIIVNITAEQQYRGLLERVVFSTLLAMPCCVFLCINGTMLFTLRSKPVFCETSRYILLYNLLFADTVQLALSQLLYLLSTYRILLTYPVCGVLVMLTKLSNDISPLTLVVMSLERYVAVCYPLRHATIITIRNTGLALCVVWAFSLLNVIIRILLLINFLFKNMESLRMKDICTDYFLLLDLITDQYDKAFTYLVFISATAVILSSYFGVIVAARSASTDKASAHKARNTLLLHLVQLGLSLISTMYNLFIQLLSTILPTLAIVRVRSVFYVFVFVLPRCLSSLIYGFRDQTIRPVLTYHLSCGLKHSGPSQC